MMRRLINKLRREWRRATRPPYHRDPRYPAYWFGRLLGGREASIVQIGSNDGKTGDPLHRLLRRNPGWRGLFVEPIPYIFERLRANYPAEERFRFANVAINDGSRMPFYYVTAAAKEAHPELPEWYDQLGSFDRSHLEGHLDGKLAPFIRQMTVDGITLPELLDRFDVREIDILHVDCEGYDWRVLSQFDLGRYRPRFILFEFHHLGAGEAAAAREYLNPHYVIHRTGIDYLAVRRDTDPATLAEIGRKMTVVV